MKSLSISSASACSQCSELGPICDLRYVIFVPSSLRLSGLTGKTGGRSGFGIGLSNTLNAGVMPVLRRFGPILTNMSRIFSGVSPAKMSDQPTRVFRLSRSAARNRSYSFLYVTAGAEVQNGQFLSKEKRTRADFRSGPVTLCFPGYSSVTGTLCFLG